MNTGTKNSPPFGGKPGPPASDQRAKGPIRYLPPRSTGFLVANGQERSVPLRGALSKGTASCCIARLLVLAAEDPRRPIITYVNSTGGVTSEALAVISTMNGIRCPIVTFCFGLVAGPAMAIAAHGFKGFRAASPSARFSFSGFDGSGTGRKLAGYESLLTLWADALAPDIEKTPAQVLQWFKSAAQFTAQEALRHGLIDLISAKPTFPKPE